MRTIAHISDLHYGREDARLAEALLDELRELAPSLVVVSGDLTQRARARQFAAAREFLERIPFPLLVVPGNHDIPLFDLIRRFFLPLHRYRHYITADLLPWYQDGELAVLGINTARSATWKNGRISREQIELIRSRFCRVPEGVLKVLVTHHPFIPPPGDPSPAIVGRAELALEAAEECKLDLLLAGHLHVGYTGDVRTHHLGVQRSIVAVQAGTAISTRVREHPNGYDLIEVDLPRLTVWGRAWDGARFRQFTETVYVEHDSQWTLVQREELPGAPPPPALAEKETSAAG